jgi:uncharacterized protein (DUF924 family)
MSPRAREVLKFWLGSGWESTAVHDPSPTEKMGLWFGSSPEIDRDMTERFQTDCEALIEGW